MLTEYCVYEDTNCTAVCGFASYAEAKAFKLAHIASADYALAHGYAKHGLRGWLVVKRSKLAHDSAVQYETQAQCIANYKACIAAGYYTADGSELAFPQP